MFRMDGKIALVTGAGQNVGAGIAKALAQQGATVVVNDYHADRAERTRDEILSAGGKAVTAVFDVSSLAAVTAAVEKIEAEVGAIDILVNNAGTGGPEERMKMIPFHDTPREYWDTIIDVNLFGVLNCCKAVINSMRARKHGRILTIASGAGLMGLNIGVSTYGAAKGGAIAFMKHLAIENAALGITANTIALGLVLQDPSLVPQLANSIPIKRVGQPEDVGYLAVYLASDEASWITGQTISLNGGATTN